MRTSIEPLHTEAGLRRARPMPGLRLPTQFAIPHQGWRSGYGKAAKGVAALRGCATWDAALPAATALLTLPLGAAFTGTWNPGNQEWVYS
ncbi:hypothetical protein [Streptomyces decoyicus]